MPVVLGLSSTGQLWLGTFLGSALKSCSILPGWHLLLTTKFHSRGVAFQRRVPERFLS